MSEGNSTGFTAQEALSKLQWDKKLWDRPEGKVAYIGAGILGLGAIAFLGLVVAPIIATIAWNIVSALFAVAVAAVVIVSIKPVSKVFMKLYQRFWRKVFEGITKADPIAAMCEFRDYFYRKLQVVKTSIEAVIAVLKGITADFLNTQREATHAVESARALEQEIARIKSQTKNPKALASALGDLPAQQTAASKRAIRLSERLTHLQERQQLCERFVTFLKGYQGAVRGQYDETVELIADKRRDYELACQTQTAVDAMKAVFGTGSEEQNSFQLACSVVDDKFAGALASMEMLQMDAAQVMSAIQVDNIVARQTGSEKLTELEQRLQSGIFTRVRVEEDTSDSSTMETGTSGYEATNDVANPNFLDGLYSTTTKR